MIRKSLTVLLLVCAMTLVVVPAVAAGAPRVHRRMVVAPRPAILAGRLEKLEGDIQKVVLDGKPAYAELVDSTGKTVKVYLGPAGALEKHKEQFVVGKHVTIVGAKRPAGLLALKIRLDDKTLRIYPRRHAVRPGVAWAWRAGYLAGRATAHGGPGLGAH